MKRFERREVGVARVATVDLEEEHLVVEVARDLAAQVSGRPWRHLRGHQHRDRRRTASRRSCPVPSPAAPPSLESTPASWAERVASRRRRAPAESSSSAYGSISVDGRQAAGVVLEGLLQGYAGLMPPIGTVSPLLLPAEAVTARYRCNVFFVAGGVEWPGARPQRRAKTTIRLTSHHVDPPSPQP